MPKIDGSKGGVFVYTGDWILWSAFFVFLVFSHETTDKISIERGPRARARQKGA